MYTHIYNHTLQYNKQDKSFHEIEPDIVSLDTTTADYPFFHYGINDSHVIARANKTKEKEYNIPNTVPTLACNNNENIFSFT